MQHPINPHPTPPETPPATPPDDPLDRAKILLEQFQPQPPAEEGQELTAGEEAKFELQVNRLAEFFMEIYPISKSEGLTLAQARHSGDMVEEERLRMDFQSRKQEEKEYDREEELKKVDVLPPGKGKGAEASTDPISYSDRRAAFRAGVRD